MRAGTVGGIAGLLLQTWVLTAGTWQLFAWQRQSDFYDVQARSILDGTLAMDQRVLGIESFAHDGRHFMYFGPIPSLLRLPVVAITRSFDGRLSAASMLVALVVILATVLRMGWRIRCRVIAAVPADDPTSGDDPDDDADDDPDQDPDHDVLGDVAAVSRLEAVAFGATTFAIVGASSLVYASSRTWVYHEAILWGVALTLASIAALLVWIDVDDVNSRQSHLWIAATSALAMLALLTRPSVAGGALASFGLIGAGVLWRAWQAQRGPAHDTSDASATGRSVASLPTLATLSAGVVVPVVLYSIVNWLKFGRLLGVPFDQQGYTLLSAQRQAMLAENGGTLFNWRFIPSNLVSYLRPDLVGVDSTFPFLHPQRPATTFGAPTYDLIDLMAGLPVTMPFLLALGAVGAWTIVRRGDARLRPFRLILIGGALGAVAVLAIGYMATRYQSDFLPLLVVSSLFGLPVVTGWLQSDRAVQGARRVLLIVAPLLLAVGLATNLALGYSYQRAYGPLVHPDTIAGYIDTQRRVDGWFGDGVPDRVAMVDELSLESSIGDIAILGDCTAMYISEGGRPLDWPLTQWRLAELAPGSGASAGTIVLEADADLGVPLVHLETMGDPVTVSVAVDQDAGVMTTVIRSAAFEQRGPDLPLRAGTPLDWQVFADPNLGRLEIFLDGRYAAFADIPIGLPIRTSVGVNPDGYSDVQPEAAATVVAVPTSTPVCDRLLRAGAR